MIIDIHDILIFSKNLKEHEQHVCLVFNKLWEKKIEVKLKKSCLFHQSTVGFWSCIIFYNGLSMSSKKIQIVINWQMPFLLRDITYFLRFAYFYWIFVQNNSKTITTFKHDSCKQGHIQVGWKFCESFQIVEKCFHYSSHSNSCIPIQAILFLK